MLQYLVILLDDTATSYCHYESTRSTHRLISLDDLKAGILFAMKQNLMIQFVYPDYELPKEYRDVVDTIDNHKIVPQKLYAETADVVVFESIDAATQDDVSLYADKICVIRSNKADFFANSEAIIPFLGKVQRVNLVLSDITTFTDTDFSLYASHLDKLRDAAKTLCVQGIYPQLNFLTDRILLDKMNNCNAGIENITLAPNGKFYVCPAFYLENENGHVGDLLAGLDIKNQTLYKIQNAPLCRNCDAYQCKRCVWLNRKTTGEVNTPSHEQCVVAHLERNVSRSLLQDLQTLNIFTDKTIKPINYLDPFEVRETL
jgi:CXXX repeat peptide maturase